MALSNGSDDLFAGRSQNRSQNSTAGEDSLGLNAVVSNRTLVLAATVKSSLNSDSADNFANENETVADRDAAFAGIITLDGLEDVLNDKPLAV